MHCIRCRYNRKNYFHMRDIRFYRIGFRSKNDLENVSARFYNRRIAGSINNAIFYIAAALQSDKIQPHWIYWIQRSLAIYYYLEWTRMIQIWKFLHIIRKNIEKEELHSSKVLAYVDSKITDSHINFKCFVRCRLLVESEFSLLEKHILFRRLIATHALF